MTCTHCGAPVPPPPPGFPEPPALPPGRLCPSCQGEFDDAQPDAPFIDPAVFDLLLGD